MFRLAMTGALLAVVACNPDPSDEWENTIGYRDGYNDDGELEGMNSGERGTIKISEFLWSGSVTDDGTWDPTDVFIEFRNEGSRPVDITGWRIRLMGDVTRTYRIPEPYSGEQLRLNVGDHAFAAAKASRCFPEPDWVIEDFELGNGDALYLRFLDQDERVIEFAGDDEQRPFAGGYDLVASRSMEKVEMMFGGRATEPQTWHHYNTAEVDVPNNDRIAEECRKFTLASPGRPNSPDYSGAFAAGGLD